MSNDLYRVIEVDENSREWNELYNQSKQHTLFMRDDYLNVLGFRSRKYVVYKKKSICMGICIPVNKDTGEACSIVPYAPYQGVLYTRNDERYSIYRENLEASSILLDYLYQNRKNDSLAFSNTIEVEDMRAIQWHHYHEPALGMYDIKIRYTSILNLNTNLDIKCGLSKGRKLDYKYSKERYRLFCEKSVDSKPFMDLYKKTFLRQGISLNCNDVSQVNGLINLLLNTGEGELYYAVDGEGNYVDGTFIVYDRDKAYYLFGANDPDYRKYGGGTLLLVEQIKMMKDRGINSFDFIGINSPQRGDYKLSFGGAIVPYYLCSVKYHS